MKIKNVKAPSFVVDAVKKAQAEDENFAANFDKKSLTCGLMGDWSPSGQVACGLWSFNHAGVTPRLELAEKAGKGIKVLATEVVDDYLSISTMLGECPFYTMLNRDDMWNWPVLDGTLKALLVDTLNYIATGERTLSLNTLDGIMQEEARDWLHHPETFKPTTLLVKANYDSLKGLSFSEFMNLWLSRRYGWDDVILSKDMIVKFRR